MSDDETRPIGADGVARQRPIYTESQVIMTTVKIVSPFVLTYGLFITFHGADTPGGGFQGGAIMASMILMIAFAFGIESTRRWLSNRAVVGLGVFGVLAFSAIAVGPLLLGGSFLEYGQYETVLGSVLGLKRYKFVKYGMEGIEIFGIAFIVSSILMGLFFALAGGYDAADATLADRDADTDEDADTDGDADTDIDAETDAEAQETVDADDDERERNR